MFLNTVPIEQHESAVYVHDFPRANREGVVQSWGDVKRQLGRAGAHGFTYVDLLSDFHLLLFLTSFLDMVRRSYYVILGSGQGDRGKASPTCLLFSVSGTTQAVSTSVACSATTALDA